MMFIEFLIITCFRVFPTLDFCYFLNFDDFQKAALFTGLEILDFNEFLIFVDFWIK